MSSKNLIGWLSLGVATIAFGFSQFPPISSYFATPKLNVSVDKTLKINHNFIGLVLVPFVHISNSGNARGSFSRMNIELTRPQDSSFKKKIFVAQTYSKTKTTDSNKQILKTPLLNVSLSPDENWEAYIDFLEPFTTAQQIESREMFNHIDQEIRKHSPERQSNKQTKWSEDLFNEIKSHVKEQLKSFPIGMYKLHLKIFDKKNTEPAAQQCRSFIVHESHLKDLNKLTEQYRYIGRNSFLDGVNFELSDCE